MKSFAEFKQNINEAQMKMSYREWLNKTGKNHSPENVELYKKTQTEEVELDEINERVVVKRAVNKIKNALGITSKGEPDHKTAPKWATHIGRTHEGVYHWLSSHSVVEKPNHNRYFPDAQRTQFTGHLDQKPGPGFVKELQRAKKRSTANEEVELDESAEQKWWNTYKNNEKINAHSENIEQYLADKDINAKVTGLTVKVHSSDVEAAKRHLAKAGYKNHKVVGGLNEDGTQLSEEKHRVLVSVSDPHHQMVSRRKELIQQHVRVSAASRDEAIAKAKAFYKKRGYRVHDAEHVGTVNEAYAVTLHHTYPDGKKEQFHYTIKSATSNKHAARIARLIHVKKNIPAKLISFEPSKDVKLIEHSELEESRGHKILSTALARMNTRKKIASGEIKVGVTRDEPSTQPTGEKKDKSEVKTVKETNDMLTYSEFVAMLDEGKADDIKDLLAAMREKRLSSYDFSKEKDEKKPNRTVYRSKKYGNGDEDDVETKSEVQSTVKRGRGRPKGSKSGARV